jgi:hypothetical protein
MTLYIGLRNYSNIKTGLRVVKGEPVDIADNKAAQDLIGDVFGLADDIEVVAAPMPQINNLAPEPDIKIDLGADDLAQKPNRARAAKSST